jgi:predicted nucleic acid-binding protein
VAPAVWPLEVANVLLVAERRRRITRAEAARFLELLGNLPVAVERTDEQNVLPVLLGLGREHRLSSYDASYLHLAMRERLRLATRDAALRAAARAVGVGWFVPDGSGRHAREDDDE